MGSEAAVETELLAAAAARGQGRGWGVVQERVGFGGPGRSSAGTSSPGGGAWSPGGRYI